MKTPVRVAITSSQDNFVPSLGSFIGMVPPTFQPTKIYNGEYACRPAIYNGRFVLHQQITIYDGECGPGRIPKAIVYGSIDDANKEFLFVEV